MTRLVKTAIVLISTGLILVAGIVLAYWWANTEPRKPANVSQKAVFLWAPYNGVPGPRRGWWLQCNQQGYGNIWCTINQVDGTIKYAGEYKPYHTNFIISPGNLQIDASKSGDLGVWIDHKNVPLIYLKNGEILIPASKYEEGRRLLNPEKTQNH